MNHPLVYELHARSWLRGLTDGRGRPVTLGKVPSEEMEGWKAAGFSHVWLMGVWEVGARARAVAQAAWQRTAQEWFGESQEADIAGSPYAIADYRVPRDLGGASGLRAFRRQLHRHGMGLLLDFVPNHLGVDHRWVGEHPERFVGSGEAREGTFEAGQANEPVWLAHGRDPHFLPWVDTVQLDYRRAETRKLVLAELTRVAEVCDGVRCDMAMLVLNEVFASTWREFPVRGGEAEAVPAREFWAEAIASVKQRDPSCLFLGEVYWDLEAMLQNLGFDYTYDKRLYDHVVARDWSGAAAYVRSRDPGFLAAGAHFLENHDEPRVAAVLSPTEHRAAAWLLMGLPGLRLLQAGQLTGACLHPPVHFARWPQEASQPEITAMYNRFLQAAAASAVGRGSARVLSPRPAWADNATWQNLVAVLWQASPPEFDLVVVNLAPHRSQGYVPLVLTDLGRCNWRMEDRLGPERYERFGEDLQNQGLYLDVEAHAAQLFHFSPL